MKKLFTLIAAAFASLAVSAQTTVFDLKNGVGTTEFSGTTTTGDVKINTNSTTVSGIKFANSIKNADGLHYAKITPAEGGFEAGDVITIAGCYNNASEKVTAVAIASNITEDGVATNLFKTSSLINGRLSADDPAAETYTLENDCDALYLYRDGGTTTFAIDLTITRPESGPKPNISLTAEVDGNTRTLGFCTLVAGTKINIDWGDGNVVEAGEGVVDDTYQTTADFTGTPVGSGNIKIYADGITVFDCVSKVAEASITKLNVSNAPDLQYLYANGNTKLATVDLTKNTELLKLSLANNPTKSIDLSKCAKLTRLELQGVAATPGALESIDLSKNTELTYISVNFNNLTSLDLSANAKVTSIYALNNQIESIVLPENSACTYISLNNNKLTSFDGANLKAMSKSKGSIFLMNNNISELNNIATKSLNVTGNKLTVSTMPDLANITTLTNAGQQDMEVAESVVSLDLTSEYDNGNTTYAVYTEDGTAQTEGVTIENGMITFDNSLNEKKFYVAMTNATYKFSGANTLKTTVFTVSTATGINGINVIANSNSAVFNLAGQRVAANAKGIIIVNGKKVLNK